MYSLHSAHVRTTRRNSRWELRDLSAMTLKYLKDNFDEIWLFVDQYSFEAPQAVYFGDLVELMREDDPALTITDWLTQMGNDTLPFRSELPRFNPQYVKYTNGWMAGFEFTPVGDPGTPTQGGSPYDKDDLLVTKENVDPLIIGKYGLFSINGLYHITDYNHQGAYIKGGNRSVRRSNDNQIGLTSFEDVGEIRCHPITESMISSAGGGRGLIKGTYITLPDTIDIENKTVLMVIGGYLQVLSKTYTRVADRSWRIELGNLSLLERYYESYKFIDYSSLGLSDYEPNPTLISKDEFFSDAVLTRYLTLQQSFVVVVDSPSFFQEYRAIETAGLPGRYYSSKTDPYPVVGAYGRLLEYHYIKENGINVVATTRNTRHNYDFYYRNASEYNRSDGGRNSARPFVQAQAFFRLMGVER